MEKKYLGYQGLQDVAGHVNTRLKTVTTIPASADDGAVRLYVGETGVTYKKGHIYQYNATDLEWVDITSSSEYTAGNGIDITNDEISVETYIFTGTQAQWDALTTEQKKEYDICNITDDTSSDDEIYTKSEIDAMLGTAASKDATDVVRPNDHDLVESNAVYAAINNALSSIYTPRGDLTCAELTSALLIEQNVGNVYQMTDSGTTSALFINGAGHAININDNVGIIKAGQDTYLFNLMGNAFDLHDYQKKDLTSAIEGQTTVEGALSALSTNKATQAEVNDIVNVLGAKNLFDGSINTTTAKGVTFTQNADGTISVTGSNTQGSSLGVFANRIQKLKAGSYILNGCPSPTSGGLHIQLSDNDAGILIAEVYDGNEVSFTLNADTNCKMMYWASGNLSITGTLIIKPMIRLASDPDNTYESYAMTNQQLTPYVQAISNPNLLDNPWFTVNQRGLSSYTGGIYSVDRWVFISSDSSTSLSVNSNGVTFAGVNDNITNRIDTDLKNALLGKTCTLSVMLADGTVYSESGTITNSGVEQIHFVNDKVNIFYSTDQYYTYVGIQAKQVNLSVRAIKLELGSVSTLAMDTVPNYQQELAKCMRYFQRMTIDATNAQIGLIRCANATTAQYYLNFPVAMRTSPSITTKNETHMYIYDSTTHVVSAISKFSEIKDSNDIVGIALNITTTGLTQNTLGLFAGGSDLSSYPFSIDFSADL